MTVLPPAYALATVLIVLSAFLFHAFFGRSTRDLVMTIVVAALGFAVGEMIARVSGHELGAVGALHLLHGLAGAWTAMSVARFFRE